MPFAAGQSWSYRAPEGFEGSRIVIGAIVTFDSGRSVVCASVLGAPRKASSGALKATDISFLPMTKEAFAQSVVAEDGSGEPAPQFADRLEAWANDPKGLSVFTVPYDGLLEDLVARQVAAIGEKSAA